GAVPVDRPRFRSPSADSTITGQAAGGDSLVARRRGRTRLTSALVCPLRPAPPSLSETLDVVVGSVIVVPLADTLTSLQDTLAPSAVARDAHGNPIPGVSPTWISSDTTIVALVAPGRLVARRNGQAVIRAVVDNDTGTASVLVAQRLARLRLSPSALQLSALTAESTIVATGLDARVAHRHDRRSRARRRQRDGADPRPERRGPGQPDRDRRATGQAGRDRARPGSAHHRAGRPAVPHGERVRQPRLPGRGSEQDSRLGDPRSDRRNGGPDGPGHGRGRWRWARRGGGRRRARYGPHHRRRSGGPRRPAAQDRNAREPQDRKS